MMHKHCISYSGALYDEYTVHSGTATKVTAVSTKILALQICVCSIRVGIEAQYMVTSAFTQQLQTA